jgi:hypothetical protein
MNAQRHWLWGTVLRSPPIKSSPSVHKASGIQFNSSSTPIVWVKQVLYSSDKADLHGFITRVVVSFVFGGRENCAIGNKKFPFNNPFQSP